MSVWSRDKRPERETPPEGLHQAVCVDVVDLGLCETKWGPKEKVELRWILDSADTKGRPYLVSGRYTNSLNEKATLRRHLEAWRGKKFTNDEARAGQDLERLIGVNGQVQIVHKLTDDGGVFANVHTVVPLGKGMAKLPVPQTYVRAKDRDENSPSDAGVGAEMDDDVVPF